MRSYELTLIFRPEEEQFSKGKEIALELLKNAKAQIEKEEDMGVRDLAYLIKKQPKGHYYYLEGKLDPESVHPIEHNLLLEQSVLKFLFVRKD